MYIKFGQNVVKCYCIVQYNLFQIKINNFKLIHLLLLFSPSGRMGGPPPSPFDTCYMAGGMPLAFMQEDFLV